MGLSPPCNHHLLGSVILNDEVRILKELQAIEVILLGDAEESSSFLDCARWRSAVSSEEIVNGNGT
jgi:hypothetical protein